MFLDTEKGNLTIRTSLEQKGEYAMVVSAKEKRSSECPTKIMYFLVSTEDNDEGNIS